MQRGLDGNCRRCRRNGDQHGPEGDEAGSSLDIMPTAAAVVEEVSFVSLTTIADPEPTALAGFEDPQHAQDEVEPFFRGGGGVELFPVHFLGNGCFIKTGSGFG